MYCTRLLVFLASILFFGFAPKAIPASINVVGGTAGMIPGGATNDFISVGLFAGPQIGGYYGSQIETNVASSTPFRLDFYGAEAGFLNDFRLMSSIIFTHPGGTIIAPSLAIPLVSFFTTLASPGLIPFSFTANSEAATVTNGSNPDDSAGLATGPNFFASCDPFGTTPDSGGRSCNVIYLFFDDGGAGPDDDHDDFLVRIAITEIPEPGTWIIVGAALVGLRALRRRR